MDDTQILALFEIVTKTLERNTEAMEKVAVAVQADATASDKMSIEVKGLRKIIAGAQQKIGGELGSVIEKSKRTLGKLEDERREVADAASQTAERSRTDARP